MKSNYKQLGAYIREIDKRNTADKKENLLGVSTQKVFIESIANTVGTDFRTYRLIKRGQFAYVPDTSRRGDKIGIALLDHVDEGMISQAYTVFEVVDENKLLSEYLMMWFRRPEFDRYARYMSYGSVREIFSWEDLCEVELPIPHIDKQREIVKEYNTILQRIDLNNQLIQKLEETAQAIYKQWFVDFEFPNENGEPYKSAGGEMVESELGDIPIGWKIGRLDSILDFKNGKTIPKSKGVFPAYGGNGITDYTSQYNYENVIAIGRVGAYCGSLFRVAGKCWISDNAICVKSKNDTNTYCFHLLKSLKLNERSEGTGQPLLTQGVLSAIEVAIPNEEVTKLYEDFAALLYNNLEKRNKQLDSLENLRATLLSKLATTSN